MKKAPFAKFAAKLGKGAAVKAAGDVSNYTYHQPKEPKILNDIRK